MRSALTRSRCCARPTASRRALSVAALLSALALGACAASRPHAEVTIALFGDTPYSHAQAHKLDEVIAQMNRAPLAFAAHVGDITSGRGPCGDDWLEARREQFARIRHPFVLLPGDNEWTDCHRTGFDPLERLAKWRDLFCQPIPAIGLVRQRGTHCENVRWQAGGYVFAGVNVPGSNNNLGRTPAMDAEHAARMRAVLAWLDEARELARGRRGLVVLMQANPFEEPRFGPSGFRELRAWLAAATADPALRVILVHGDTHRYRDDTPLPRLRRIEVPGSPEVRWLRVGLGAEGLHVSLEDPEF